MAERGFSLESVLAIREAELETIERELSRLGQERALEKEKTRLMHSQREQGLTSFDDKPDGYKMAFLMACYEWLEHMEGLIAMQTRREDQLDGEYEKVRQAWKKARMEKEKILLLRERYQGQERRRSIRAEERSMEIWVQSRDALRTSAKGER